MKHRRETKEFLKWERSIRDAGISIEAWAVHFGMGSPGQVCCRDCVDFFGGLCKGGGDPVKCMRDAVCIVVPF